MDAPEISADPPIAIEAVFERDLLDFVAAPPERSSPEVGHVVPER